MIRVFKAEPVPEGCAELPVFPAPYTSYRSPENAFTALLKTSKCLSTVPKYPIPYIINMFVSL